MRSSDTTNLLRGASPLGLPYTLSRAPLRRRAPVAWLTRCARSRVLFLATVQARFLGAHDHERQHTRPDEPCAEAIERRVAGWRQGGVPPAVVANHRNELGRPVRLAASVTGHGPPGADRIEDRRLCPLPGEDIG